MTVRCTISRFDQTVLALVQVVVLMLVLVLVLVLVGGQTETGTEVGRERDHVSEALTTNPADAKNVKVIGATVTVLEWSGLKMSPTCIRC